MQRKIFQRYHGKENIHSSNALMLLQQLYFYSPQKFYDTITAIFETQNFMPEFIPQDTGNGKSSIPDFSIMQQGFKIVVEAKENSRNFNLEQIERHLENLNNSEINDYKFKLFIALSPQSDLEIPFDELQKKYENLKIKQITYLELYSFIRKQLIEIREYEFIDVLEDYKNYCQEEGLIDTSDDTVMVRATGDTYKFNVENGVYYDDSKDSAFGYKYLALYTNKFVRSVGKISRIIEAYEKDGKIIFGRKIFYSGKKEVTEDDRKKIEKAIKDREKRYHNAGMPHWHFIVEKFVGVDMQKKGIGGLFGKKKFSLSNDFKIKDIRKCNIEDVAKAMQGYEQW